MKDQLTHFNTKDDFLLFDVIEQVESSAEMLCRSLACA